MKTTILKLIKGEHRMLIVDQDNWIKLEISIKTDWSVRGRQDEFVVRTSFFYQRCAA